MLVRLHMTSLKFTRDLRESLRGSRLRYLSLNEPRPNFTSQHHRRRKIKSSTLPKLLRYLFCSRLTALTFLRLNHVLQIVNCRYWLQEKRLGCEEAGGSSTIMNQPSFHRGIVETELHLTDRESCLGHTCMLPTLLGQR